MQYLPPVMHLRRLSCARPVWYVVLLLLTAPLVTALEEVPPDTSGSEILEQAATLIYSQTGSTDEILDLLDGAERRFRRIGNPVERDYWIARTHLVRTIRYNQIGRDGAAERSARAGLESIRDALAEGVFSEGLRVLSDLHSQMMMAKGLFYMVRNGSEARDAALEALERAPRNIKAQITVAGFLLNAPPMAGGDTEQARLVLERALAQEPASVNDRFLILGWLAQASHTLDDTEAAERYFAEAFSIYPESEWLAEIGEEIME
jgi:tetratricopeptide (TPR) repeat protein